MTSIREFDDPSDDPATRPAIRPGPAVLRRREVAWLGGVACVGVILCWAVSRNAFNVPVDGQAYLGAAHNLAAGKGLTTPFAVFTSRLSPDRQLAFHGAIPLTHFPPAFPVLLAAVSKFGMATSTAARVCNALLFGINAFLVGALAWRASRVLPVAVVATGLVVLGPTLPDPFGQRVSWMYLHASALSEPLFFCFVLASLWFLTDYLAVGSTKAMVLAASFAGAALLTRFAGVASVVTVVVAAALWAPCARRRRLRGAAVAAAIGIIPSAVASLYVSRVLHGEGSREFASHVVWIELRTMGEFVSSWFLPSSVGAGAREIIVGAGFVALAIAYVVSSRRNPRDREASMLVRVLALFAVAYTVVVLVSRDFLDVSIPIDARILSPLQPVAYVLLIALAAPVIRTWGPAGRRAGFAVLLCLLVLVASEAVTPTVDFVRDGSPGLDGSPGGVALDALRRLPRDALVVTLLAGWVSQYSGRATIRLPNRLDGLTNEPNPHFDADVRQAAELLERRPATYLFLYPGAPPGSFAGAEDVGQYVPLVVVTPLPQGGAILAAASPD